MLAVRGRIHMDVTTWTAAHGTQGGYRSPGGKRGTTSDKGLRESSARRGLLALPRAWMTWQRRSGPGWRARCHVTNAKVTEMNVQVTHIQAARSSATPATSSSSSTVMPATAAPAEGAARTLSMEAGQVGLQGTGSQ